MMNVMTVDRGIRELISHDCPNGHVDTHPIFESIIDEIETPADVGLVTLMTANLCSNFITGMVGGVRFAALRLDENIEHDNLPEIVAARLIACMLNDDFATATAVASAEAADPSHAEEVLAALLQMAHDL